MSRLDNHRFVPPKSQYESYERMTIARRELRIVQAIQREYTTEYLVARDITLLPNRSRLRERAAWLSIEIAMLKAWYDALPYALAEDRAGLQGPPPPQDGVE